MAYLMVRYDAALLLAQNPVFLFFTDKYDLDCLKQILLRNCLASLLDCEDRCLVDHIRKI